jgi:hypothetical protein
VSCWEFHFNYEVHTEVRPAQNAGAVVQTESGFGGEGNGREDWKQEINILTFAKFGDLG